MKNRQLARKSGNIQHSFVTLGNEGGRQQVIALAQNNSARAIAEQNTGGAVLGGEVAAYRLSRDNKNALCAVSHKESIGNIKRVNESRAGCVHIECGAFSAQPLLNDASHRRGDIVGAQSSADYQIKLVCGEICFV